ncbi:hypothetical protein AB4Z27_15485 [Cupriavidus sp. KB_39]
MASFLGVAVAVVLPSVLAVSVGKKLAELLAAEILGDVWGM